MAGFRRRAVTALIGGLMFLQAGCSLYMYDKGKSEAAKSAKGSFASFSKSSPERFEAMTKNLQRIAAEEDALVADLVAQTDQTRVTLTPTDSISNLLAAIRELCGDPAASPPVEGALVTFQKQQYKAIRDVLDVTQQHKNSITETGAAVTAAEEQVKAAKNNLTRWNQTQAVLLTAIESLPEVREKVKESKKTSFAAALGDALGQVAGPAGEKDVTYSDSDGVQKTAKLKDLVADLGKGAAASASKGGLDSFIKTPGADLVVLNLALELAKIQQRRAKLVVERDEALVVTAHDAYLAAEISRTVLTDSANHLESVGRRHSTKDPQGKIPMNPTTGKPELDATPLSIVKASRAVIANVKAGQPGDADSAAADVSLLLRALCQAAVARSMAVRTTKTFELRTARVAHEHSIADSALNDEEWRAVVSSGIDGLDRYFENGVRPEDVANFIRLGQAIATGVIAGKVD